MVVALLEEDGINKAMIVLDSQEPFPWLLWAKSHLLKNHVAQTLKSVQKWSAAFLKKFGWNIRVKRQDHIGNMKKVLGIFLTSFEWSEKGVVGTNL